MILSTASELSAFGVTAFLIIAPLTLIGGLLVFVRLWPWRSRVYTSWLIAVLLAIALPIALPYAIWQPAYYDHASSSADCASIAKDYASNTHPIAKLWPTSVSVNQCSGGGLSEPGFRYDVDVTARGPYGIPFGSTTISNYNEGLITPDGGQVLGLVALMTGVAAVSIPFAGVWLASHFRGRPPPGAAYGLSATTYTPR